MRTFEGFQKGVNFGGWLSQADETTEEHYQRFITESDIKEAASLGIDHLRLPVDYTLIESEDGQPLEQGYVHVDRAVDWAEKYGLNLLLDMHNTYGYTFDPLAVGADREIFFRDASLQKRFFQMWDRISSRYGTRRHVAVELLNEVISPSIAEEWNIIADQTVDVIRKNASKSWIVIGGVRYNNVTSVPLLHQPKDDHIVYNFHCYEPMIFTHQRAYWVEHMPNDITVHYPDTAEHYIAQASGISDDLAGALTRVDSSSSGTELFELLFAPAIETAAQRNVPLYCGEYGVIDQAPVEDTLRWLQDIHEVFERHGIGRSLWNYKEKDFGLTEEHYASIRTAMAELL